jgi:hypothetical protein
MDLQEAKQIAAEREERERAELEAAELLYVQRQRAAAASFAAQAETRHTRKIAEARTVVREWQTAVTALGRIDADAMFRSTGQVGGQVALLAGDVLAAARQRLERLEAED